MRPTPVEIIRGIQGALATHVLPEVSSRYAQAQVMYSMMLLEMVSKEIDEAAHHLTEANRTMRGIFARGAELIDGLDARDRALHALAADLRAAAADGPAAPSLRVPDLQAENERLRLLLTRLGEACDRARENDSMSALLPLWDEIMAHLLEEAGQRAVAVPGR